MKTLLLVRHGETVWNVQKRIQGSSDSPLTTLGEQQARSNGALLTREGVARLYASPLGRVRQTVKFMSLSLEPDAIHFDNRLREIEQGQWEGLTWQEVGDGFSEIYRRRSKDLYRTRAPGGESRSDVVERVIPVVQEVLSSSDSAGTPVAIVAHGIVIRLIIEHLLGFDHNSRHRFHVWNQIVYRIEIEEGRTTASYFMDGEGPYNGLRFGDM